jgi:hypothetical protein
MSILERLAAKPPSDVLDELEALAARSRRGEKIAVPHVTLHLRGGHSISGAFLSYEKRTIAIHASQTRGALDVAYAPVESISALIVHHQESTPVEAAGKLVLDRRANELGRVRPLAIDWTGLGTSDSARRAVTSVLDAIGPILDRVRADDLGKRAFDERVERIEIARATHAGAALEGKTLVIGVVDERGEFFAPGPDGLHRAIEAVL